MFKIGVQTGGPEEILGIDETYRMIKEAGFDAVDCNLDHLLEGVDIRKKLKNEVFTTDDEEVFYSYFKPYKDAAEKYGLDTYQAHAPFPGILQDDTPVEDPYNDFMMEVYRRCIKGCAYLNCHRLIVHPFIKAYDYKMDPQEEWNVNIRKYSELIETAKQYDVIICLENMFVTHNFPYYSKIKAAACNNPVMACRYIDTLNEIAGSKVFGFCLDIGHLQLVGLDVKDFITILGDRIEAFHVHDNDAQKDLHVMPFTGTVDWKRFVEGLREIGYSKTMCFETFNAYRNFGTELGPYVLKLIAETGRLFDRQASMQ